MKNQNRFDALSLCISAPVFPKTGSHFSAGALMAVALMFGAFDAQAHNGVKHGTPEEAIAHEALIPDENGAPNSPSNLPFPTNIGGDYLLTDHHGQPRDKSDPLGRAQLIFFGYATCEAICSAALPRMAQATDLLEKAGHVVQPLLITVDPTRDNPETMRAELEPLHPRFLGLSGAPDALAAAQKAFHVESSFVNTTSAGKPIYAHGSYIYLMDANGEFLTLFPPIIGAERIAEVAKGYLDASGEETQ